MKTRKNVEPQNAACRIGAGVSLIEVLVAMVISVSAMLVVAPALGLSLKVLQTDRYSFDRQVAIEQVWQEISEHPELFPSMLQKDCRVGEDRIFTIQVQKLPAQGALFRWKLYTSDGAYSEERWLSR